ncbi:MAG: hypothetical protein KTR32_29545 [Granulosicoccus sp.]|nr:hypothetical protein [Granulosicoccus sp.]
MDRRQFHRLCSSMLAGAATLSQHAVAQTTTNQAQQYPRSRIVGTDNMPLSYQDLAVGSSLIFHYPFVTTPCFLIRLTPGEYGSASLTDKAGNDYTWQGGAGPDHSLVAFSAICTHKMSHPSKPISHLNFRTDEKEIHTRDGQKKKMNQMIMCCSEHSVYDPAEGARVISGPATQPLTAIELEVNADGLISATGLYGGDMFDPFLEKFGFRLALEHSVSDVRTPAGDNTVAISADVFSQQQIRC